MVNATGLAACILWLPKLRVRGDPRFGGHAPVLPHREYLRTLFGLGLGFVGRARRQNDKPSAVRGLEDRALGRLPPRHGDYQKSTLTDIPTRAMAQILAIRGDYFNRVCNQTFLALRNH